MIGGYFNGIFDCAILEVELPKEDSYNIGLHQTVSLKNAFVRAGYLKCNLPEGEKYSTTLPSALIWYYPS